MQQRCVAASAVLHAFQMFCLLQKLIEVFVHSVICTHTLHGANVMYMCMCAPHLQVDGQTRESGEEETAAAASPGLSFLFVFGMMLVMVTVERLDVANEMSSLMPRVSYKVGAQSALR